MNSQPGVFSRGAAIGIALIISTLLGNSVVAYRNVKRLRDGGEAVVDSYERIVLLKTLLKSLVDAETGQRGFIITGKEEFLDPYRTGIEDVKKSLDRLAKFGGDDSIPAEELNALGTLIHRRLDWAQLAIEKARETQGDKDPRFLQTAAEGKKAMDEIRALIGRAEDRQRVLLEQRSLDAANGYRAGIFTLAVSAVMGILLAGAGYHFLYRDAELKYRSALALREANERLESRVEQRTHELTAANGLLVREVETRRQAEEEAQRLAEELGRSNRDLEQFAAVASHDLQEPLRKIQAFGDRLSTQCGPKLEEKGRDYIERMLAAAARMRRLIDDLLSFSRISRKGQAFQSVALQTVAEEVLGDLENAVQQSGASVTVENLPTVEADPFQMRQLLQNLLGNAIKFRDPERPPVIQVTGRVIETSSPASPRRVQCEVCVADNGMGFEQVYADRIFELFQRLHGRDKLEGTGMGLAICKKIVERHGGTIRAESKPGEGSRFVFTLPMEQSTSGEATA